MLTEEQRRLHDNESSRKYYATHKAQIKIRRTPYYRAYYQRNRVKLLEYCASYYSRKKDRIRNRNNRRDPDRRIRNRISLDNYHRYRNKWLAKLWARRHIPRAVNGALIPPKEPLGLTYAQNKQLIETLGLSYD